ncbi:TetR/AcrR family transcriptional regulator [Arthrobacter sp. RHLT1-20]
MTQQLEATRRTPLNRRRVLQAAVALADEVGFEPLSMRKLAEELGVVPMALYKHVASKEELLDGMVASLIGEIDPPVTDSDWKSAVRLRVLSARRALQRHPWARQAIESRTNKTPAVLGYMESFTGLFLTGGFSADLTHHVMHAIGGRMWGFTQELFEDPAVPAGPTTESLADVPPEAQAAMFQQMAARYPNIVAIATSMAHDEGSVVGHGCDDQFEFEFALDLLLDGFERLHEQGWSSRRAKPDGS